MVVGIPEAMSEARERAGSEDVGETFGPALVEALTAEAESTRLHGARALDALASDPVAVESLARRLLSTLPDAERQAPLVRALATLAERDEDAVGRALASVGASRRVRRAVWNADPWPLGASSDGGPAVGGLRQVVGGDGRDGETPVFEREMPDEAPVDASTDCETPVDASADSEQPGDREDVSVIERDDAAASRRERIERAERSRTFRAIALLGSFDELHVVEPEQAVRYGSTLRARGRRDGAEMGVAVRLFDRPDGGEQRRAHDAGVAEALARWADVADHDGVLAVHDWGDHPRPWAVTDCVEGTLADRGRTAPARALRETAHLAAAVAHCHRNGVVHAGLDPHAVVYPEAGLDGVPSPRIDAVGLLEPIRAHLDPAEYLDPRYAAPEYFERRFGRVDAATDVYGLGAVAFRLLTGRAPYDGPVAAVRSAVVEGDPPLPSEVADCPPALDPIFAKALARDKMARYETCAALRADLEQVAERLA